MGQHIIKECSDASPAVVQGMAYAAVMKGQKFSANVKKTFGGKNKDSSRAITCYNCGRSGYMQKDCKKSKGSNKRVPGLCPQCKKGKHWKSECKSKFHNDGTLLDENNNNNNNNKPDKYNTKSLRSWSEKG